MKIYGDYHNHTRFSDGHNSVDEVVRAAIAEGLREVAITDHGFYNKWFSLTPQKFSRQLTAVDEARVKYPEISILQGIEGDIVDFDGTLDITPEQMDRLDILVAGFHRFVRSTSAANSVRFVMYNGFWPLKKSAAAKEKNTKAYISAIENYPIDILSHIGNYAEVDVAKVCRVAADYGTMIELNMKHLDLVELHIGEILASDCMLIVNSDAHKAEKTGKFNAFESLIEKYNIPKERIANLDGRPVFTRLAEYKRERKENGQAKL